jgi:hypothetical protein
LSQNSFIFLNSYISILSCPIFRRARFPSQAPPRCITTFLGTRRTHHPTLQVTIVGPPGSRCSILRGENASLLVTSLRHLQDPTLHYAFPHTCSCHQHVTAWTSTRLSWTEYIDDTWSVTSAQLEHRYSSASPQTKYLKPARSSVKHSTSRHIHPCHWSTFVATDIGSSLLRI